MLLFIQFLALLCSLPLRLLRERDQWGAAFVLLIVLGPLLCYGGLVLFFPEVNGAEESTRSTPRPGVRFVPNVCFACTGEIPEGRSVCPTCGWDFKAAHPSKVAAGASSGLDD